MVSDAVEAFVASTPSATATTNAKVPAAVGVPVIAPVVAFTDNPAGSEPDASDHAYAPEPPEACSVALYVVVARAPGSEAVVMATGGAPIAIVNEAFAVLDVFVGSVTAIVNVPETAAVGVPLIAPVDAFRDSPAGSAPLRSEEHTS